MKMALKETEQLIERFKRDHSACRCDACGRFISYEDLELGYAVKRLVYPDSHFTTEEYETLCSKHR